MNHLLASLGISKQPFTASWWLSRSQDQLRCVSYWFPGFAHQFSEGDPMEGEKRDKGKGWSGGHLLLGTWLGLTNQCSSLQSPSISKPISRESQPGLENQPGLKHIPLHPVMDRDTFHYGRCSGFSLSTELLIALGTERPLFHFHGWKFQGKDFHPGGTMGGMRDSK